MLSFINLLFSVTFTITNVIILIAIIIINLKSTIPSYKAKFIIAPVLPPKIGANTGIHPYLKFKLPFSGIGNNKYARRGPKSLAGFKAAPVTPPKETPNININPPTTIGFNPSTKLFLSRTNNENINIPVIKYSLIKFEKLFFIDGDVTKIFNFVSESLVFSQ